MTIEQAQNFLNRVNAVEKHREGNFVIFRSRTTNKCYKLARQGSNYQIEPGTVRWACGSEFFFGEWGSQVILNT